jgi:hypothetical protein
MVVSIGDMIRYDVGMDRLLQMVWWLHGLGRWYRMMVFTIGDMIWYDDSNDSVND